MWHTSISSWRVLCHVSSILVIAVFRSLHWDMHQYLTGEIYVTFYTTPNPFHLNKTCLNQSMSSSMTNVRCSEIISAEEDCITMNNIQNTDYRLARSFYTGIAFDVTACYNSIGTVLILYNKLLQQQAYELSNSDNQAKK